METLNSTLKTPAALPHAAPGPISFHADLEKLPPIFDTRTLARWSGIESRRWADLRVAGTGPVFCKIGTRQVVYTRASVADWLKQQTRTSTADTGEMQEAA